MRGAIRCGGIRRLRAGAACRAEARSPGFQDAALFRSPPVSVPRTPRTRRLWRWFPLAPPTRAIASFRFSRWQLRRPRHSGNEEPRRNAIGLPRLSRRTRATPRSNADSGNPASLVRSFRVHLSLRLSVDRMRPHRLSGRPSPLLRGDQARADFWGEPPQPS